jgi:hypothetical protein
VIREGTLAWSADVAPPAWLRVPADADAEWKAGAAVLVASTLVGPSPDSVEPDPEVVRELSEESIDLLVEFAAAVEPGDAIVAALGVMGRTPVPVHVAVAPHDPRDPADLLAACGATGGDPLDPPFVERFDVPDGDAVRVVRVDRGPDGAVWATACLGRRTDVADTVLVWRTTDLDLLAVMPDRLDALLDAIRVEARLEELAS